jgi:hypothetical protein
MAPKKIQADRFRAFAGVIDAVEALPNPDKRVVLTAVLELVPGELARRPPIVVRRALKALKRGPKPGRVQKCTICGKPGHNAKGHHNHAGP